MIFVGGIHGVGKTTFCKCFYKRFNINTYSASRLIEQKRNEQFSKDKKISNISSNQNVLIDALTELKISEQHYLLDGHFCLINKHGEVSRIPEETFFDLSPKGIILLIDSVEKIFGRLKQRDKFSFTVNFLERFQNEELKYSKEIANMLNIPYLVHNSSEHLDDIDSFLKDIIPNN